MLCVLLPGHQPSLDFFSATDHHRTSVLTLTDTGLCPTADRQQTFSLPPTVANFCKMPTDVGVLPGH
ncbi:hypothetical protein MA16_Dca017924 [Dendrobium catenatum]|uniref:Uncharacterized protein n=1 Tax=Dendrobium catenatum TaxID=906689 RepID=A0A2I0W9U8_9ASPA|nr:hypothetical protein MA16_Dca017924 [Dendrobium catenatum]